VDIELLRVAGELSLAFRGYSYDGGVFLFDGGAAAGDLEGRWRVSSPWCIDPAALLSMQDCLTHQAGVSVTVRSDGGSLSMSYSDGAATLPPSDVAELVDDSIRTAYTALRDAGVF
jgi:hypothetical protein